MSPRARVLRKTLKTLLPILLVIFLAVVIVCCWIVSSITRPPRAAYLITPQTFSTVTGPILKATDVTWKNHDGTDARGWLIRGAEGAPAVILLHGYGADRSWLLNLAVKLNETTNFTVLWPDLRGHGENPPVNWTLFGSVEGDDVAAAVDFVHSLKTPEGKSQIGARFGIYGIGLGAYAALDAARRTNDVRALALDSVPASPEDLIAAATSARMSMRSTVLQRLAVLGVRIYALGKFQNTPSCELARSLRDVRVQLLVGGEGDPSRRSSVDLVQCIKGQVDVRKDLTLTGANLPSATGEQEEAYDRPVIEFFDKSLR
jgi:pimeloyl-ACP methyl ester carboxylesterase